MKTNTFNTAIFKLREFKSHTPNILGAIIHPVQEEGIYLGILYNGEQELRRLLITCTTDAPDTQLNIDFSEHTAVGKAIDNAMPEYALKKEGYVLLYTSIQLADFYLKLYQKVNDKQKLIFNSKLLGPGDIYTVTLLEPGKYIAQNSVDKSKMKIAVTLPETQKGKPLPTFEPITLEVNATGFSAKEIKINSTQGIVFLLKAKTDVIIKFEDNNDKKGNEPVKDGRYFRWNNPNIVPNK